MPFSLPKIELPSGNNAAIGIAAELLAPGTGILAGSASQVLAPQTSDPGFFQNIGNSMSNWFKSDPKPTAAGDPSAPTENYADQNNKYLLIAVVVVVVIIIAFVLMRKKKPAVTGS
jgi:hypothetical protein